MPGFSDLDLTCPVSKQQYVYVPGGYGLTQSDGSRVILFDASSVHDNTRRAMSITEPASLGQAPLITKVIPLPESFFRVQVQQP